MWFDPTELAKAPPCAPATSATLRLSEELPSVTIPKVAESQESQAPRVRALVKGAAKAGAGDTARTPADDRMGKVIDKLHGEPGLRYAMEAHDGIEPDAVILTLAIRDKAACELRIPKSRYDALALLELIEKHTTRETLQ